MRLFAYMTAVCALGLWLSGCEGATPAPAAAAPQEQAATASSGESPADMCEEHGVLEAVCTKCKPALIPVFKSKGDWCKEHELPESICPICHPERGGRPDADAATRRRGGATGGARGGPQERATVSRKKKRSRQENP